jgi:hypothetical protein
MKNPDDSRLNINVRLLRRIEKEILAKPEKFDMRDYARPVGVGHEDWANRAYTEQDSFELCKTTACIAGWADLLQNRRCSIYGIASRAIEILGLTYEQADRLFYLGVQTHDEHWPEQFERPYLKAIKKKKWADAAQIAVERIEHFIKTRGAE